MENDFHDWLRARLPAHPALQRSVGDDAAILSAPANEQLVVAADAIMDGVHFHLAEHGGAAAGRKALAVNLSDLAAMAARPLTATVSLALPRHDAANLAREVLEGMIPLAEEFDFSICGGDTNCWDHPLVISVTVIGTVPIDCGWRRDGGHVGDRLVVTGPLGGSLAGKHLTFRPRVDEALRWRDQFTVNAAIDISDGLAMDASRLAAASNCGAVIATERVPISNAAREAAKAGSDSTTPLQHALGDGEDFELLLAMPAREADRFTGENAAAVDVGQLQAEPGLWRRRGDETLEPLEGQGYQHG